MPKPKKPVVIWSGERWLATKWGRVVFNGMGFPFMLRVRRGIEYSRNAPEKAVRVLVTITRIEEG
jgi:hypothetical protein